MEKNCDNCKHCKNIDSLNDRCQRCSALSDIYNHYRMWEAKEVKKVKKVKKSKIISLGDHIEFEKQLDKFIAEYEVVDIYYSAIYTPSEGAFDRVLIVYEEEIE